MTPCIHTDHRDGHALCPSCRAQYDADPTAWVEYGHHEAGERRWAELLSEMQTARRTDATPADDADWPL